MHAGQQALSAGHRGAQRSTVAHQRGPRSTGPLKGWRVEGKQVAGEGSKVTASLTHGWAGLSPPAQWSRQSKGPVTRGPGCAGPGGPLRHPPPAGADKSSFT